MGCRSLKLAVFLDARASLHPPSCVVPGAICEIKLNARDETFEGSGNGSKAYSWHDMLSLPLAACSPRRGACPARADERVHVQAKN